MSKSILSSSTLLILLLAYCFESVVSLEEGKEITNRSEPNRVKKILNVFSVVRFPNGACKSASNRNGTCYAEDECKNKGGTGSGSCASGYGTCCIFAVGCGTTSSENCTYFESVGSEQGECTARICPCSDDICQYRLDFSSFVINQPDQTNVATHNLVHTALNASTKTQCNIDQFSVTAPGSTPPPVVCGTLTGDHMIVEASDLCNDLSFSLDPKSVSTVTRTWSIKITQYKCNYENLAPSGCTEWYYGEVQRYNVNTYNFGSGHHLANQNQNICIRRERNYCKICWWTSVNGDFETSSISVGGINGLQKSACCGYGYNGNYGNARAPTAYDCAMIPSALNTAGTANCLADLSAWKINGHFLKCDQTCCAAGAAYGFCGGELNCNASGDPKTICSSRVPFEIRFLSDNFEFQAQDGMVTPNGFRLGYTQVAC